MSYCTRWWPGAHTEPPGSVARASSQAKGWGSVLALQAGDSSRSLLVSPILKS